MGSGKREVGGGKRDTSDRDVIALIAPLIARLGSRESVEYGLRPIPCPLDDVAERVAAVYESATENERRAIDDRLTERIRSGLSAYGERMASQAVRSRDPAPLRRALVAAAAGWCYEDPRESLLILPLFYDAAMKLGLDPGGLFRGAAALVADNAAAHIAGFPNRASEDRSLACMGYREGQDEDGFRYLREW